MRNVRWQFEFKSQFLAAFASRGFMGQKIISRILLWFNWKQRESWRTFNLRMINIAESNLHSSCCILNWHQTRSTFKDSVERHLSLPSDPISAKLLQSWNLSTFVDCVPMLTCNGTRKDFLKRFTILKALELCLESLMKAEGFSHWNYSRRKARFMHWRKLAFCGFKSLETTQLGRTPRTGVSSVFAIFNKDSL